MIGRLVGRLVTDDVDGNLLLDVEGVGYELTVPLGTVGRARRDAQNGTLALIVHTYVREDRLELFGFASELERRIFRLLLGLPKLGPKLSLSVLSALPPKDLARAVSLKDVRRLSKVQGIGKKTAERLILELTERLPRLEGMDSPDAASVPTPSNDEARLHGALVNMGYKPAEATAAVEKVKDRLGTEPISDLLRSALAELSG